MRHDRFEFICRAAGTLGKAGAVVPVGEGGSDPFLKAEASPTRGSFRHLPHIQVQALKGWENVPSHGRPRILELETQAARRFRAVSLHRSRIPLDESVRTERPSRR